MSVNETFFANPLDHKRAAEEVKQSAKHQKMTRYQLVEMLSKASSMKIM
jgi:hypothetical protein